MNSSHTNDDFTMDELKKSIKHLKNNKAPGPDGIPVEAIKSSPDFVLEILLKLLNKIKRQRCFPTKWGMGITTLLHKTGDTTDPNNYRPITVTNSMSKILNSILNNRLSNWISEKKLLCKEQIGFQRDSRPSDHLFVLKTLIDCHKNANKKLFICFVDFEKAFDSVWREGMFHKLL